jgi:hypothetical protein
VNTGRSSEDAVPKCLYYRNRDKLGVVGLGGMLLLSLLCVYSLFRSLNLVFVHAFRQWSYGSKFRVPSSEFHDHSCPAIMNPNPELHLPCEFVHLCIVHSRKQKHGPEWDRLFLSQTCQLSFPTTSNEWRDPAPRRSFFAQAQINLRRPQASILVCGSATCCVYTKSHDADRIQASRPRGRHGENHRRPSEGKGFGLGALYGTFSPWKYLPN